MLHFAYGANMSRAVMRKHAPGAQPIGVAVLANYRFVITADGYASVEPMRAAVLHSVKLSKRFGAWMPSHWPTSPLTERPQ